jgi:hypothetical protein
MSSLRTNIQAHIREHTHGAYASTHKQEGQWDKKGENEKMSSLVFGEDKT